MILIWKIKKTDDIYKAIYEILKNAHRIILNGYNHYRVFHHENEFARGKSHVNGIERFWSYAQRRLAKFNGLTDDKFILHLKECECKFNHRNDSNFSEFVSNSFFNLQ